MHLGPKGPSRDALKGPSSRHLFGFRNSQPNRAKVSFVKRFPKLPALCAHRRQSKSRCRTAQTCAPFRNATRSLWVSLFGPEKTVMIQKHKLDHFHATCVIPTRFSYGVARCRKPVSTVSMSYHPSVTEVKLSLVDMNGPFW